MVQATTVSPPKVVRIIEPTIPIHETVKTTYRALRVAAYCRVSTKQEEQLHSYETQVKHYTERIQAENGWILEGIYADKGITGTSYKKRDEFNRMIRRCKQGKIDMIIVKSIARFARNTVDCLKFVRMLNDLNVVVYFEEQGIYSNQPGAEFYITIYGSIAQSESENISANVKWGKARSAKEGNVPFHYKNFLGYRKGADGKPEINPEEAETIRFIYERFLAGDSLSGIAQKLNDLQVPTPSGKGLWQNSTIQSILSNEKYKGDAIINKTYIKDCLSKKVMVNNGERPKYYLWHKNKTKQDLRKNYNCVKDGIILYRIREGLPSLNDSSVDYVVQRNQEDLSDILKKLLSEITETVIDVDLKRDSIAIENLREYAEKETSFLFSNPEAAREWNYEKNGNLKPEHFAANSHKKVWWKCKKGHEWQATIKDRNNGNGCPYCSSKIILKGFNDLQSTNPTLVAEWNYEKNNGLTPVDVMPNSSKKVWWRCSKGHEWQARVADRNKGRGCPYCANKKVLKGYNDLQTVNPTLAAEWNYEKNNGLTPMAVSPNSHAKVWWKCSKGHEWQAIIGNRNKGNGCPYCAGQRTYKDKND